jgi:hypothetical protein
MPVIAANERDRIETAIMVLGSDHLCVPGLTQDFALNLKKTGLNGCSTALRLRALEQHGADKDGELKPAI